MTDLCDNKVKEELLVKIAVLHEQIKSSDKSLLIQAKEYERRLESLNHEAERLRVMQATYLPREVYETHHKELKNKIEALQKLVFVGMGFLLCLELALKIFIN